MNGKKGFKNLLGMDQKLKFSQKFMHFYEKSKRFRYGFGIGMGIFLTGNLLIIIPGTKFFMQKELKQATAKTLLQFHYLSILYTEALILNMRIS